MFFLWPSVSSPCLNRNQVSQLRQAIETASLATPQRDARPHTIPIGATISAHTSPRTFDAFLSSINKVGNLAEAKRLRSDIDREIHTLRSSDHHPVTDEERKREEAHLKRLEKARRRVEKRIERLSGRSPVGSRETVSRSTRLRNRKLAKCSSAEWSAPSNASFHSNSNVGTLPTTNPRQSVVACPFYRVHGPPGPVKHNSVLACSKQFPNAIGRQ